MKKENKIDLIISGVSTIIFIILIIIINQIRKMNALEHFRLTVNCQWILYPLSYSILFYGLSKLFFCFNEINIKKLYLLMIVGILAAILLPYLYFAIIINFNSYNSNIYDISTKIYNFYKDYVLAIFATIGFLLGAIKIKKSY